MCNVYYADVDDVDTLLKNLDTPFHENTPPTSGTRAHNNGRANAAFSQEVLWNHFDKKTHFEEMKLNFLDSQKNSFTHMDSLHLLHALLSLLTISPMWLTFFFLSFSPGRIASV